MNIKKMDPYHKRVREGDYFFVSLVVGGYVIGRVVHHQSSEDFVLGGYLVYVYNSVDQEVPSVPLYSHLDLMIPPLFVNGLGWKRGYFGHICNRPVLASERYSVHSFTGCGFSPTGIVNEFGNPLQRVEGPSRQYTISNYKMFDYYLSEKLGLDLTTAGVEG
jgi:hypothetical protein